MKKPAALTALIEDLRAEVLNTSVGAYAESKAVIYLDDDAAGDEDGIVLHHSDCEVLFHSAKTVDSLFEALSNPTEASIELHELDLAADALNAMERRFVAVDEV